MPMLPGSTASDDLCADQGIVGACRRWSRYFGLSHGIVLFAFSQTATRGSRNRPASWLARCRLSARNRHIAGKYSNPWATFLSNAAPATFVAPNVGVHIDIHRSAWRVVPCLAGCSSNMVRQHPIVITIHPTSFSAFTGDVIFVSMLPRGLDTGDGTIVSMDSYRIRSISVHAGTR